MVTSKIIYVRKITFFTRDNLDKTLAQKINYHIKNNNLSKTKLK